MTMHNLFTVLKFYCSEDENWPYCKVPAKRGQSLGAKQVREEAIPFTLNSAK